MTLCFLGDGCNLYNFNRTYLRSISLRALRYLSVFMSFEEWLLILRNIKCLYLYSQISPHTTRDVCDLFVYMFTSTLCRLGLKSFIEHITVSTGCKRSVCVSSLCTCGFISIRAIKKHTFELGNRLKDRYRGKSMLVTVGVYLNSQVVHILFQW